MTSSPMGLTGRRCVLQYADIGAALGCGAHLAALRRTVVGSLELADALTLADLEARDEAGRLACLLPVAALPASAQTYC